MDFRNVNKNDVLLDDGEANDVGWRADVTYALREGWIAEFGGDVLRSTAARARQRTFDGATEPVTLSNYSATGGAASAYAQLSARVGPITITPGARVDRWQATDTTMSSPWITAEWAMTSTMQLRGGAGIYRQFPDLTMLHGLNGNPDLQPERATHADLAIVRTFPNSVSVHVTGYRRDERDVLRIADSEPRRLTDGTIVLGRGDAQWSNRLSGRAHGVEVLLRRDAPDALSGWIAYAYSRHRYDDAVTGERFWGDYDQRHTLSTYALYRLSNRSTPRREVSVRQQLSDHRLCWTAVILAECSPAVRRRATAVLWPHRPAQHAAAARLRTPGRPRRPRSVVVGAPRHAVRGSRQRTEPPQRAERAGKCHLLRCALKSATTGSMCPSATSSTPNRRRPRTTLFPCPRSPASGRAVTNRCADDP